jgi:hypothetical protein
MDIRLYMLCYRSEALVASHLPPEEFGHYMATGTRKAARGSLMFFEIDRARLGPDVFRLRDLQERCAPHADGSPKRSKYISIYRVLENLNLSAIQQLHLVTLDGRILSLAPSEPDNGPTAFLSFMTDPEVPLYVPKLFFADLLLDREGGRLAGYLPYEDPAHLAHCIDEMAASREKYTKTVSRTPAIRAFYRTVGRGFYVGGSGKALFFRFPERRVLETEHARWWRSAQAS